MPRRYAQDTDVTPQRSREEIERLLKTRGATKRLIYEDDAGEVVVQCFLRDRMVRFEIRLPPEETFWFDRTGKRLGAKQAAGARDKEWRRRWRVMLLWLKAKFEILDMAEPEEEDEAFEREFLGHIVLPDGETVADYLRPQIDHAYASGQMPALLTSGLKALPAPDDRT